MGGSEVLVVELVMASIAPNAERTDGTTSPTLMARAGTGGGQLPILILTDRNDSDELSENNGSANGEQPSRQLLRTGCVQRHVGDGE